MEPTARLTRRKSHRGQTVQIVLRNGSTATGTLDAWGQYILRLREADGKCHEYVAQLVTVYAA